MDSLLANKIRKSISTALVIKPNTSFEQITALLKYTNPEVFQDDKLMTMAKEFFNDEVNVIKNRSKITSNL